MFLKKIVFFGLALILIFGMGCSSGGTISGAGQGNTGSGNSLAGTWNVVSTNMTNPPTQFIFNADGTGSIVGGAANGPFVWTVIGNNLIFGLQASGDATYIFSWTDQNNIFLNESAASNPIFFSLRRV